MGEFGSRCLPRSLRGSAILLAGVSDSGWSATCWFVIIHIQVEVLVVCLSWSYRLLVSLQSVTTRNSHTDSWPFWVRTRLLLIKTERQQGLTCQLLHLVRIRLSIKIENWICFTRLLESGKVFELLSTWVHVQRWLDCLSFLEAQLDLWLSPSWLVAQMQMLVWWYIRESIYFVSIDHRRALHLVWLLSLDEYSHWLSLLLFYHWVADCVDRSEIVLGLITFILTALVHHLGTFLCHIATQDWWLASLF